jgi:hypothetical protein
MVGMNHEVGGRSGGKDMRAVKSVIAFIQAQG